MKDWQKLWKNVSMLGQFGLSLTVPLLLCLFLCSWLSGQFSLGSWIYIPGFFFGLGGSAMTAWRFFLSAAREEKKDKKKKPRPPKAFNRH